MGWIFLELNKKKSDHLFVRPARNWSNLMNHFCLTNWKSFSNLSSEKILSILLQESNFTAVLLS